MPNHLKIPVVCTKFAGCETGARAVPINKPLWTEDMSTTFSASLDRRNWTRIDNLKPVEQPKEYIGDSHGNLQLWAVLIIALGSVGFIGYLILGALCVVKRRKKQYAAAIELGTPPAQRITRFAVGSTGGFRIPAFYFEERATTSDISAVNMYPPSAISG